MVLTPSELMQRFYTAQLGADGQGADPALRASLKLSFRTHEDEAATAFNDVMSQIPDTERQLRFSAQIAGLSSSRDPENSPRNAEHLRLAVNGFAVSAFINVTLRQPHPEVFDAITRYSEDIAASHAMVRSITRSYLVDGIEDGHYVGVRRQTAEATLDFLYGNKAAFN